MYFKSYNFSRKSQLFLIIAIAAFIIAVFVPTVFAEEIPAENNDWKFRAAPYLWLVALDGDVTVKGQESELDLSFSDIWDELNIATMLTFDARNGKWGILGDMIVANLGKSTSGDRIKIDPMVKLALLAAGISYRLGTWNLSDTAGKNVPAVTIEGCSVFATPTSILS